MRAEETWKCLLCGKDQVVKRTYQRNVGDAPMNDKQKGGNKTYRMPGREGRAAQHLFDLAVSDLCNAPAQQQKRSASGS